MIRIEELFRLEHIGHLRLIAGAQGLDRKVTAAVLFEYDPSRMQLADFYRGDLVVTTLAFARGDEQLVLPTLVALINQGVAGLLIKTAYFREMPPDVVRMADRLGTPILLFDETYIEEVILEVTELIRGRRHFAGFEQDLDALMGGELGAAQIREKVRRIDPVGAQAYRVYALDPRERMPALENRVYDALCREEAVAHRFICMAWRRMLLVLERIEEAEQAQDANGEMGEAVGIGALLSPAGINAQALLIGKSAPCGADALGTALCEAVYAARAAHLLSRGTLRAQELGLLAYLLPMSENAFIRDRCRATIRRLREYDAQNHTSLEQTARVYVQEGMEILPAAKKLFQHPNTVRYRLSKIRQLMEMGDDRAFDLLLCLTIRLAGIIGEEGA